MKTKVIPEDVGQFLADKIKIAQSSITTVQSSITTLQTAVKNLEDSALPVDTALDANSENPVQNKVIKQALDNINVTYDDTAILNKIGDLDSLNTADKANLVSAINELKFGLDGLGEPFRVKQWASNALNVEIPCCTEDIGNTSIPKMVYTIDDVEGADYQIVGMISYELFDAASGGQRINAWPVCQFTGNGQKELGVRWTCMGSTRKTAKRISAWVLLKHR